MLFRSEEQAISASKPGIKGARTASNIMLELMERAADTLTHDELKWFSGASEVAAEQARNLSKVIEVIGCLVDADGIGDCRSGNFQNASDVAAMMFNISDQLNTITGMINISNEANCRLKNPEFYQAKSRGAE